MPCLPSHLTCRRTLHAFCVLRALRALRTLHCLRALHTLRAMRVLRAFVSYVFARFTSLTCNTSLRALLGFNFMVRGLAHTE